MYLGYGQTRLAGQIDDADQVYVIFAVKDGTVGFILYEVVEGENEEEQWERTRYQAQFGVEATLSASQSYSGKWRLYATGYGPDNEFSTDGDIIVD
ncbi:MAG: hypothetical protein PVJ34_11795 [Anaerolineae bacterium]|jgi:hypothetical protein